MISSKEAIQNVHKWVGDTFFEGASVIAGLEEIEKSADGENWIITMSFVDNALPGKIVKSLKVFTVDGQTGEVESMKMWKDPADLPF